MFIDKTRPFVVKAGRGGNGALSFLHIKSNEFGGPDGGNGGRGGSIILKATSDESTLMRFSHVKKIQAEDGEKGQKKKMYGHAAENIYVKVPVGTVVFEEPNHTFLADLSKEGQEFVVAKGGRGGRGNACFTTSVIQAPKVAENGLPGQERTITLEMKLLADVGLVGLPSVGKSTLLSVISAAKPEIADYPFTTITPNLGVTYLKDGSSFVVADLPGLIEGASQGKGLGLQFLRHIERCRVIVHVLDMTHDDPLNDFETINKELETYGFNLLKRPMIVACSKVEDEITEEQYEKVKKALEGKYDVYPISALTNDRIDILLYKIKDVLANAEYFPLYEEKDQDVKVYDAHLDLKEEFRIEKVGPHAFKICGERIERTYSLINLTSDEGVLKLLSILRNLKVDDKLKEMGAVDGDSVTLCDFEFDYFE